MTRQEVLPRSRGWKSKPRRSRGSAAFACPRCGPKQPTRVLRTARDPKNGTVVRERLCTCCGWSGDTREKKIR